MSTGFEEAVLFSRGGSAPLFVDAKEDADDEVQEVEAPPKSAAELAELAACQRGHLWKV